MKKMFIILALVILTQMSLASANLCWTWDGSSSVDVCAQVSDTDCIGCSPEGATSPHTTGKDNGNGPEFSTVGITAIIALAAGGAIGFNIGKKKK